MRRVVVGLLALLSGACFSDSARTPAKTEPPREAPVAMPAPAKPDSAFERIKTAEVEGIIIPADRAQRFIGTDWTVKFSEAWTPSQADVLALEKGIQAYLRQAAPDRSERGWSNLAEYRRQYVGVVLEKRRVIWANFFCSFGGDWTTQRVVVDDGGECFFTVRYDVDSATFSDLRINGEA